MFTATRRLKIDAGHRVPSHGSKCKNLHGHEYKIFATAGISTLVQSGEQEGMVMDFGFLKSAMMRHIDALCDHRFITYYRDEVISKAFFGSPNKLEELWEARKTEFDSCEIKTEDEQWFYVVNFIPTAENLARHWFQMLDKCIYDFGAHREVKMISVQVFETENCSAVYPSNLPIMR